MTLAAKQKASKKGSKRPPVQSAADGEFEPEALNAAPVTNDRYGRDASIQKEI